MCIRDRSIFGTTRRSSDYAQALMELGATICKPFNPVCDMCPINHNCKALIKKDFTLKKILKKNKKKVSRRNTISCCHKNLDTIKL